MVIGESARLVYDPGLQSCKFLVPRHMLALEVEDFDAAFKHRLACVKTMASRRRYGHIV